MKHRPDLRICILGAGPAGLTAAECLREKGYADITLIERSGDAGGKCHTINHEGRNYELGAGIVADSSRFIRRLAEKYGVPMERVDFAARLYLDAETGKPLRRAPSETLRLCWQLLRYYRLARRYKRIAEPGFSRIELELCDPFSAWAKRHGIEALADEFINYFTGFGYGFFDEVPAAYVLKYYPWDIVFAYLKRSFYKFPEGIQGLWSAVARAHRVLYGTVVQRIERGETVRIATNNGSLEYDALILTSPLDEATAFLDTSDEERILFSKIRHEDYRTYACLLRNFPRVTGYVPANMTRARAGRPVFWYQRYTDSDVYTFYLFGDEGIDDPAALEQIRHIVQQLGGTLDRLVTTRRWKFFPHVAPEEMRAGFFDKLEAVQGAKKTYIAGELMNFSTVTHSAAYARDLVERFF